MNAAADPGMPAPDGQPQTAHALETSMAPANFRSDHTTMASGQSGAAHARARTFADVRYDDALARAQALAPTLRARAAETEALRGMSAETVADLHHAGLFRISQPRRYGGMELDYVALFEIPAELARGCASTAWMVGNLAIHHWMLALYDERAQEEVWSADADALIAGAIAFPQGHGKQVDGGFIIDGHWHFSSAVDACEWNMVAVTVRDGKKVTGHRMCLVRRSDYEIIDDWQVLGMRGTGSKSVRAKNLFVPEYRALDMHACRGGSDFPGARTNPSALYRIPLTSLGTYCLVGAAVGNAHAALELTCEAVAARSTSYTAARMRDLQTVQLRVGAAGARIDTARVLCRSDCLMAQEMAEAGRVLSIEEKLRVRRNVAFAAQLCTEAVDTLHTMAGANGIYDSYPIQRIFRDAHALAAHIGFAFDAHGAAWGLVALGGEYSNPTL